MARFFTLLLLLGCWLAPRLASAQGVTPQAITTDDGATIVFNTMDSFFVVDVPGDEVKPAPGAKGYFQADKRLVRLFNTPDKELNKTAGARVLMPREILQMAQKRDLDEEQFTLQRPVQNPKQEYLTTPKGRLVLHWWFDLPAGASGGATQRHYMSTICNREVLTLCIPLLPGDTPEALQQYMLGIMASVRESDDPINVKEYAKELRGTESK